MWKTTCKNNYKLSSSHASELLESRSSFGKPVHSQVAGSWSSKTWNKSLLIHGSRPTSGGTLLRTLYLSKIVHKNDLTNVQRWITLQLCITLNGWSQSSMVYKATGSFCSNFFSFTQFSIIMLPICARLMTDGANADVKTRHRGTERSSNFRFAIKKDCSLSWEQTCFSSPFWSLQLEESHRITVIVCQLTRIFNCQRILPVWHSKSNQYRSEC